MIIHNTGKGFHGMSSHLPNTSHNGSEEEIEFPNGSNALGGNVRPTVACIRRRRRPQRQFSYQHGCRAANTTVRKGSVFFRHLPRLMTFCTLSCSVVLIIALIFVSGAFGVTVTYYSDPQCGKRASDPLNGVPNPFVFILNTCVKAFERADNSTLYSKATVCSSSSYTIDSFASSSCIGNPTIVTAGKPGDCISSNPPPGSLSYKVDCSAGSHASSFVALILAFVFAAVCTQL